MKLKHLLMKTLFVALVCLVGGTSSVWATDVPAPVYFNDFSSTTGLTQVGSGEFITDGDTRFGKIYHNNPVKNKTARTNYLKLPADVLTHSETKKQMTIGFWVNMKNASGENFFQSAVFSAYATSTPGVNNGSPMFRCSAKGVMQLNNGDGHWSDFTKEENDVEAKKTAGNTESTVYLDDAKWHYYTVTLTSNKGVIYVDGTVVNSWTLSDDAIIPAFFTTAAANGYPVVCLGGNQSWDWNDWDASFGYDDFAVYDVALTPAQIEKIIAKKNLTVETYNFTSASPENSTGCVSEGNVTVDGSSLQILGNTYFDMKGRFAGGTKDGGVSNWYIAKNNAGLLEGSGNASKDFAILNLTAGDYVAINYTNNGATYSFKGEHNITGLAENTPIVSGQKYEIITTGSLLISCARNSSNNPYITSIEIGTSTPVLNKPIVSFNSMVESGGLYYPKYTFSSTDDGVTFYDGDGNNITSGYTFTSAGSQTVYAGKAGRTNSAKVSFSADKVGMILANSVNCKALSGTIDYSTGTVFSSGRFDNSGTFSTSLVPGLSFASDQWYATTGGVYTASGNRTVSCTVLNDNRVATFKHYDYDVAANIYNYLTTANNSTSIKRQGGSTPKNDYLHEYNLYVLPSEVVSVTIGSTGYSTFSSPVPLNFAGIDGLTAYVATEVAGGNVTFTSVTTAPANTGLLLKGTAGQEYNIPVAASAATPASNLMVGCIVNTTVAVDATSKFNNYVLVNNGGTAQFQSLVDNGATIPAGKAFLKNGAYSTGARSLTIVFDDEDVTGVNEVRSQKEDVRSEWFDLQGRKVAQPAKGLYIVNGKKVVIK